MLKGKMKFRLGNEQRVCGPGDVVVIPGGTEHEAWVREDTEVIDFFAPPRDDFLLGGNLEGALRSPFKSRRVTIPSGKHRGPDPADGAGRLLSGWRAIVRRLGQSAS